VWLSRIFNKPQTDSRDSLSWLKTDIHSHLIPGIDDGSPDIETSIELVKKFIALGYKKIITTPHILWEMYPNTPEIINRGLVALREEVKNQQLDVEIHAGAEYFIDEHFAEHVKNKHPLLTIKDNLVLVEVSTMTAPFDFKEILFEMQMQNYQPVIAHPERYIYLKNNREFFDDLKTTGCYFQLNLLSLTSHYGTSVQDLAQWLIKKEYYDYAGTDCHHLHHIDLLNKIFSSSMYRRLKESGQLQNHLL
jgi:protein-tyrosine phosphatase